MVKLTTWDPFRTLSPWRSWMEDAEDSFSHSRGLKIRETDNTLVAEAVVAGIPAKDVEVHIEDGVLTIKAEKQEEKKDKESYQSSSYQYYYTAALSGGQWSKADAEIEDGVVTVTIPKSPEVKPRKIAVKPKAKK